MFARTLGHENLINQEKSPRWYSTETGIYSSKHRSVPLQTDPFLDAVSAVFSHRHDGVTALVDSASGSSISYSQLHSLVKSMASGLYHHMGVKQDDVVLILLPNSINFPVVFLGILYLGAIVTTMNPSSSLREIRKQVTNCNVCLAFTSHENVEKVSKLGVPVVGVPENFDPDSKQGEYLDFYEIISGKFGFLPKPLIKQDDIAAIMHSSGTTGASKGVLITHRNFIAMLELFVRFEASQYEYSSSSNVYLAVLPMFHIFGLSQFVLGFLSLGSSIIVMRKFDHGEVLRVVDRYEITHFPVVPPMLMALTKMAKGVHGNGLKSLKQVSCGAAPLSNKIIEEFVHALPHVDLIQGYGMTESTAVGTRGFNTENFKKYSSVGLLAPNTEAKIVDSKTASFLSPGNRGELLLRGPGIMKGYLNNVEETRMAIDKDGWLHTGDIAYFDQDGYLYIVDRIKEIIKYKGFQIAPADLEAVLISHPEILDAAVTAILDEECGEIPVAFVVRRHGSALTHEAVINYVAAQVCHYKKVRKVFFINSIPKSAAGKILRRELRSILQSRL